jgi:toxin ParE1/3/4
MLQICAHYLERGSPQAAESFERRTFAALRKAVLPFPNSGRSRPEFGHGVRSYPLPPYVVFYQIRGREMLVLRILHGHRDIHPPLISLLMAG